MKFIFKWLFRLFLLGVVLLVIFFLSLDTVLRVVAENRIRAQTGMDVEIGKFHLGLLEPVVTIKNLKIHNPPDFGGTPFLDIPEIHIEYDRAAFKNKQIRITLMRFNLGELDIVKNEAGKTNLFEFGVTLPTKQSLGATPQPGLAELKKRTGMQFQQIDVLNVSVGTVKYLDLKDPRQNREQKIAIENLVINNVKTPPTLPAWACWSLLRSGDFFGSLVAPATGLK